MNSFKSSAELKGMAKEQLFGKYGTVIGASLLFLMITLLMTYLPKFVIGTNSLPGLIIYYLVSFIISIFSGIFASGKAFLYLKLTCRQPISVGDIFYGFKVFPDKALLIQLVLSLVSYICHAPMLIFYRLYFRHPQDTVYLLLMSIFTVIGMAVIIIVQLMLSQAFYLLQDFPQYSAKELLKMSRQIMKRHKGRLFYIQMSFIPLFLLGFYSCCIAFLWIIPYANTVQANFYMDLMKNRSAGH